jgi:hypothetical protein
MLFEYIFSKDLLCNDNFLSYAFIGVRLAIVCYQVLIPLKMHIIASTANVEEFEEYFGEECDLDFYKMKTFIGDNLETMSTESLSFDPSDYDHLLQLRKASEMFNLHGQMLEEHHVSLNHVQDILSSFKTETLMEPNINEQLLEILSNTFGSNII